MTGMLNKSPRMKRIMPVLRCSPKMRSYSSHPPLQMSTLQGPMKSWIKKKSNTIQSHNLLLVTGFPIIFARSFSTSFFNFAENVMFLPGQRFYSFYPYLRCYCEVELLTNNNLRDFLFVLFLHTRLLSHQVFREE